MKNHDRWTTTGSSDLSGIDSISRWLLDVAGQTDEEIAAQKQLLKLRLPSPLIPADFNPDTLPSISDVPNILYTRPVWLDCPLDQTKRRIRSEFLSRFRTLDQIRSVYGKNWLSTDDICDALSILLTRNQCKPDDLRDEDARMLGMTPDQFALFRTSNIRVTCANDKMRQQAKIALGSCT